MKFLRTLVFCSLLVLGTTHAGADTLRTDQFVVDYDPEDRATAEETLAWLEAAVTEFAPHLEFGEETVQVRIASSMNEFLGLSGTYAHVGVSGVTRADRSLIALKSPRLRSLGDDYRGTVRHELVHILLHRNTNTRNLPRWLNEGICMMLANELRWGSTLQVARMHLYGQILPPDALDHSLTMPGSDHQFGNAYAQSLSMTRHLHDEVGEADFWEVVKAMEDRSFASALLEKAGLTVPDFWEDYRGGLWGLTIISVFRTGSFWGGIGVLCIVTFCVRRVRNRAIVRRWEEAESQDEGEESFDWDTILEDADDWKQ